MVQIAKIAALKAKAKELNVVRFETRYPQFTDSYEVRSELDDETALALIKAMHDYDLKHSLGRIARVDLRERRR